MNIGIFHPILPIITNNDAGVDTYCFPLELNNGDAAISSSIYE